MTHLHYTQTCTSMIRSAIVQPCSHGNGLWSKFLTQTFELLTLWSQQILLWSVTQHYIAIVESIFWPLDDKSASWLVDPCTKCLLTPDFILTVAKAMASYRYNMGVTTLMLASTLRVPWSLDSMMVCSGPLDGCAKVKATYRAVVNLLVLSVWC